MKRNDGRAEGKSGNGRKRRKNGDKKCGSEEKEKEGTGNMGREKKSRSDYVRKDGKYDRECKERGGEETKGMKRKE